MADESTPDVVRAGLSVDEMRRRAVDLAFAGDETRFQEFCDVLRENLPAGTAAVLRGSSVTGERWEDGALRQRGTGHERPRRDARRRRRPRPL